MISLDQVLGLLYGCALGDAMGLRFEFAYGREPYDTRLQPYGSVLAGQVSDDTELMISLAQSIVKHHGYNEEETIKQYTAWVASQPFDMGVTTRTLFNSPPFRAVEMYRANYKAMYTDRPVSTWSQSNGCLMRCMPLFALDEQARQKDCAVTNPHPHCMEANKVYFRMVENIINNGFTPIDESWSNTPVIQQVIQDVLDYPGVKRDVSKQRGWVCHGLYFACMMYQYPEQFNTFAKAMEFVISRHMDSDTDTNACIAGSIVGLRLGYQTLANEPIIQDNLKQIIECPSSRPDWLHPKHLQELAIELVNIYNTHA